MTVNNLQIGDKAVLESGNLQKLFDALNEENYTLVGPTVSDEAIVYDELSSVEDLPRGWVDEQDGGIYRLKRREDNAYFGFAVGPHSWKKYLHPPIKKLFSAKKDSKGFKINSVSENIPKYAFIAVRACELNAISIQDNVFINGNYTDPYYKSVRENVFIIAVNCGHAGGTCFCVSMDAGPKAESGFDLSLTEIIKSDQHQFLVEIGTEKGLKILDQIPLNDVTSGIIKTAESIIDKTASAMGREMNTEGIKDLLYRNYENKSWDEVADRCLTCANCTMVCPTCFCTTVEDVTDLSGEYTERIQKWDSCFTLDFSYLHGGSVRYKAKSRYRQWMTHKLATWIDQFGSSGCVGCGRCITWCPVAIDITEEVSKIRHSEKINLEESGNDEN
ncbi:MAG: sulfite reductase subunit A [Candidatus Dadabacteria bacterium]|nr:sulfite reductase subunit A [Candidatus Dadabacteria bacterium]NIQ13948.1 sulfite reductase subunit A [Candidatus Dadabacteria bacterium]